MKSILLILLMLFSAIFVNAQKVRRIKAAELKSYVQNSTKPQILNFWASWCAPCMEEMPSLLAMARQYGDSLELVLISLDFKTAFPDKLNSFVSSKKLAGTQYWLDESDADYFCPLIDSTWTGAIPATLFINQSTGHRYFAEKQLSSSEIDAAVKDLMSMQD